MMMMKKIFKSMILLLLTRLVVVSSNIFTYSSNLGSDSPDAFALNGKGSQTLAMRNYGDNFNNEVTIHTTTRSDDGIDISVPLSEFIPINDFNHLDIIGNHIMGELLFVTEVNKLDSVINVYHSDWYGGEWSLLQTIEPPVNTTIEIYDPYLYFGRKFSIDYKTNQVIAVAYGDATQFLNYPVGYGKICLYEATSPKADEWLLSQVLTMPNAVSDVILRMGGSFVNIHDDVLVTDTFFTTPDYRLEIFHRGKNGLWSHQQSFSATSAQADVTLSVVYDKTIVYAINDLTSSGSDLIGKSSVHIMHPNTPDYSSSSSRRLDKSKPKPKPQPIQWTLVQTLWSPNHDLSDPSAGSDVGFGQDMALYENMLTVSEVGNGTNTGFLYVYTRTSKIGMFSLQQTIVPSIPSNNYLSLHTVNNGMLMASSILTTNGASNDIWLGVNTNWGCLNIRLEDAYGDGWDGAKLRVEAPTKDKDFFAPLCYTNPLVFRYCPVDISDEGLYKFEIVDYKSAKFPWEIRWLVTEENTGKLFRGDYLTQMDFLFKDGNFKSGKISHDISVNATCKTCGGYPVKPKPKPKPKPKSSPGAFPHRMLGKDDDSSTASPTMSPAPTLAVTAGVTNWDYMTMTTTGGDWFRDEYTGTHFYISDTSGEKLVSTGTLCDGVLSGSCVQNLPNGQYVLRVTGDLNSYSADHTWSFCSRVGSASDSLTFQIYNGACVPLLRVTKADACVVINPVSGVASYNIALGSFIMSGVRQGKMTTQEKNIFAEAVAHTIPGAVSGGVRVKSVENDINNEGVKVTFTVELKTQELGYDILDYSSISSMIKMEQNNLGSSTLGQKMAAELSAGTLGVTKRSFFSDMTSIKLHSFELGDIEIAKSSLSDFINSKDAIPTSDTNDVDAVDVFVDAKRDASGLYVWLGIAGYVVAVLAIIGSVFIVVLKKRHAAEFVQDKDNATEI